jgi:hypothetical protein
VASKLAEKWRKDDEESLRKYGEEAEKAEYQKLMGRTMEDLREIADYYKIKNTGTREELVKRIMNSDPPHMECNCSAPSSGSGNRSRCNPGDYSP